MVERAGAPRSKALSEGLLLAGALRPVLTFSTSSEKWEKKKPWAVVGSGRLVCDGMGRTHGFNRFRPSYVLSVEERALDMVM